ncbi:cupin-like domain-containing protein [Ferrimonas balearica]|uniref:cupin-like domain-containing protein n=1 Tax=Ferrimonas balearica TaxID=44012 RepID=UPI001C99424C|nr:cupin-like domain-containing protein [Ferrimonas balearica]MBY5922344.1 cupin-like domain-containing protein [Ferrimonas balearica]MBY5994316.1 cupin-like domain-containing protein [Ferrimonas balearica]
MKRTPVEEIAAVPVAALRERIRERNEPLIFRGQCEAWPLVQAGRRSAREAARLLMSHYQGAPVIAYRLPPEAQGRVFYNETLDGFNYQAGRLDLGQVLEALFTEERQEKPAGIYVGSTEIGHTFPGLSTEHHIDLGEVEPMANLWLGNRSRVAAHFDFPHNLACNLVGNRTFTLFPPEQVSNLYIGPMELAPGGQPISMVDPAAPDLSRYPKYAEAQAASLTAELAPGDLLYLPSMWWHQVESLADFNVLLTHWWRDSPAYLGRPNNALLHAILALRSLPKAQRQAWKAIFEHYVFDHDADDLPQLPQQAQGMLTKPLDERNARKLRAELSNHLKR